MCMHYSHIAQHVILCMVHIAQVVGEVVQSLCARCGGCGGAGGRGTGEGGEGGGGGCAGEGDGAGDHLQTCPLPRPAERPAQDR